MSEPEDEPDPVSRPRDPHAEVLRGLTVEVFRAAVVGGLGAWVVAVAVCGVVYGRTGLSGAVVGGAVALGAAMVSLGLMRATVTYAPQHVAAALLGGFAVKLGLLMAVLATLFDSPVLHPGALSYSMIAGILAIATAEALAFRRVRIPSVIIEPDPVVATGDPGRTGEAVRAE